MAFDYAEISDTAEELIDEFGRQVMLRSAGAPDPATPWIAGVPVVTPAQAVQDEYTGLERVGSEIQAGDVRFLIAAKGAPAIDPSYRIHDGSLVYSVVSVAKVEPGDMPILYDVQARV